MSAIKTPQEQITYANLLFYGCWGALALMVLTFLIYVSGILAPHVPLEQIASLWGNPVSVYLQKANVPNGWGWVALIGQGDFLNFTGVVVLAGMTIVCYLTLIPAFLKEKQTIFTVIAILEVAVLTLAASGIVGGGGH
ncbi:MAG: DUF1634 domain-containing protein [Thermodesulfobacteriota bacterium]